MKINAHEIFAFINKYQYEIRGMSITQDYTIASIFEPVERGFYYFSGLYDQFNHKISQSIVLVSEQFELDEVENRNSYIIFSHSTNVQEVYYKLLSELYGRKSNAKISHLSNINSNVDISENVQIDAFVDIEENVTIGKNTIIGSHVKIHKGSVIGEHVIIESGSIIGTQGVAWVWDSTGEGKIVQPQLGGVRIAQNSFLGANTIIVRGSLNESTTIGKYCLLAPGCRLGHGTILHDYVHLANGVITGGNTILGKYSFIGSGAIFRPKTFLHEKTIVGAGALVVKNTSKTNLTLMGVPAKEYETKIHPSGMPKPKN